MYNALEPHTPPSVLQFESFLNNSCMRSILHAGDQTYDLLSVGVYSKFSESDFYFSPKKELERLLNANYRILIYSAQFDLIVTHFGQSKFLETLDWHGAQSFQKAPRKHWKVNNRIAGYVREYDNLVHLFIRNAGHTGKNWTECFQLSTSCNLWFHSLLWPTILVRRNGSHVYKIRARHIKSVFVLNLSYF